MDLLGGVAVRSEFLEEPDVAPLEPDDRQALSSLGIWTLPAEILGTVLRCVLAMDGPGPYGLVQNEQDARPGTVRTGFHVTGQGVLRKVGTLLG